MTTRRIDLQTLERQLRIDGQPVSLGARAFDLLVELSSRPGALRTKNELIEAVWPGVIVEEGNLATQISTLRKVLGGDVIATIPGRGYRFTARLGDAPSEATTPAAPTPAPARAPAAEKLHTNLPERLPPLIGRDDDLAALDVLVRDHALVSIVGAGGMGKTALAQAFLHARRASYPHGVCFVDLAPVTGPSAVAATVIAALGLNADSGDPLKTLCALCAPLQMLLALDNAEHLLEATAQVAQALVDAAPGVRLIVTSQAPLKLAAECVHRLDALDVPQGPLPAAQARAFGAVALFEARAIQADSRWRLGDDNAPAVIEVCRALDGLALAIELAAARAPMLGVARLAAAMDERLKLLGAGRNRAAPARQQTLRAALEWSHGFLDERERAVFRRLAVFAGSGSLAMIQQVVADPEGELDEWDVLDALALLVDRSLVAVLTDDGAEPRYRLLDTPRAYALERLREAGEEDRLRQRHLQAMAAFCEAEWHRYVSGEVGVRDWQHAFSRDADNAVEATAHAIARGDRVALAQIGAIRLIHMFKTYAAQRIAVTELLLPWIDDSVPATLRVRLWVGVSRALVNVRPRLSRGQARRALTLLQTETELQDERFLRYLANCFLAIAAAQADPDDTGEVQAALAEARSLEDPRWPAQRRCWRHQAEFISAPSDSAEAPRLGRELLALEFARGDDGFITRSNLIDAELAAGDAHAAARTGEGLLADLQGGRDEHALVLARLNLAAAWLALDEAPRARELARAGWPRSSRFDLQSSWADYLTLLAALESRPRAAARLAGYADAAYAAQNDHRQSNEAAAHARACTLARAALGDAEFERLEAEGRLLRDDDIAAIAFAESTPG